MSRRRGPLGLLAALLRRDAEARGEDVPAPVRPPPHAAAGAGCRCAPSSWNDPSRHGSHVFRFLASGPCR